MDDPRAADDQGAPVTTGDPGLLDVAHLARLARLALDEDELELYAVQLTEVMRMVARVGEVDGDVTPTTHVAPVIDVTRHDVPEPCLERAIVLAQAPRAEDGYFCAPRPDV